MKIIKNFQDIETLRRSNAFNALLLDFVSHHLHSLIKAHTKGAEELFSLGREVRLILVESDIEFKEINFHPKNLAINAANWDFHALEFIQRHLLSNGSHAYLIALKTDYELIEMVVQSDWLENDTVEWLNSFDPMSSNELILKKLKDTFDQTITGENPADVPDSVWVMAVAAKPFTFDQTVESFYPTAMVENTDWYSLPTQPKHFVRVILRTASEQGANPYVDGTDFCMIVNELRQTAEFFLENTCFEAAPKYEGSDISTAIAWLKQLGEPICLQLNDPYLPIGRQ